jgi:3-isopropylmalate/(R)-2-methylmalate dehydratase small subunit
MERFTALTVIACPLGLANVDTDQLISARFMKRSHAQGYGGFLLHDLRFDDAGGPVTGFVLNDPRYAEAKVLVARRNFGSGSSREAAVYALWDYGIRCVVAPSFGDIFASNAAKNGLLTATVSEAGVERLLAVLEQYDPVLTIDLETQAIVHTTMTIGFEINASRRLQMLNGWDDLDLTLRHTDAISAFRDARLKYAPWLVPSQA